MTGGSLILNNVVNGGNFSSASAANNGLSNAFSNNATLDGFQVGSSSVSA